MQNPPYWRVLLYTFSMPFEKEHVFHEEDSADIYAPATEEMSGDKTVKINKIEQSAESPKSLFMQAYEKVRNTDNVSNIVDNISIWWKGRHIDAVEKDIQRLKGLARIQGDEASRHERRLQASDEAASQLAEMRQVMNMKDSAPSHNVSREEEYLAVQGRAELHRVETNAMHRELARKQELKAQFERDRDDARTRIAQRFQNNIDLNIEAINNVDNNVVEIKKNLEIADTIVGGLRAKQQAAQLIASNPEVLSADKTVAQAMARDFEGRIQDMQSKIQLQKEKISQYETKKAALETQKAKWESRITKKSDQIETSEDEVSDDEKIDSFVEETEQQIAEREDAASSDVQASVEHAPHALALLEDLQLFMQNPDMKKYNDPDFQELVLEQGTPEQKALLKASGFFTNLFGFLESPVEAKKETQSENQKDNISAFAHEYDEIIDSIDDPKIEELFDTEHRKRIEQGEGTPEQSLLVKLLDFLETVFASLEVRPDAKKPEKNIL